MRPSISVVIPCYNAEGTLEKCLRSVFQQTLPPSEVFLIDDASSDGTLRVAQSLAAQSPVGVLTQVISQPKNAGPSAARNVGIDRCNSDFIALIDSDDYWLPEHLENNFKVSQTLATPDFAIVHQPLVDDALSQETKQQTKEIHFRLFSVAYYLFIQKNCSTITLFAPAACVRRSRFPEGRNFAEDFEFFIGLFRRVSKRAYIVTPRTAVMGKHAWASGAGLSSKHGAMFIGTLKAMTRSIGLTPYAPLLLVLIPWHTLKFVRRMVILIKQSKY